MRNAMRDLNPTTSVRPGEAFPVEHFVDYVRERVPGCDGDLIISQFPNGKSNLTYRLAFDDRTLVLRRPPLGTKAKSAHDMGREFRVMAAIKPYFEPVPQVYCHCADEGLIGSEFFLMEDVPGYAVGRRFPREWDWGRSEHHQFCRHFWDGLIALHTLDCHSHGLDHLGRPEGYEARQILGWNKRYRNAVTPDVADGEDVMTWLENRIPTEAKPAIVHNDYRIDNLILSPTDPSQVAAVIDWEMATVGNPLMDLGNSLAYWTEAADDDADVGVVSQPSDEVGMFTRRDVLAYYEEKTGRDLSQFEFYYVAGLFRLAGIVQQIYYRFYHGQTEDKRFATMGATVCRLLTRCQHVMSGGAF